MPEDLNQLGVSAAMQGDLSKAEQHFITALALQPKNPGIFLNIAKLMQMQGRHFDLVRLYKTHMEEHCWDDQPIQIRFQVAHSALQTSNFSLVVNLLSKVQPSEQHQPEIALPLSEALIQIGKLNRAGEILKEALNIHPKDPSLLTNLAIVETERGEYARAEALYGLVVDTRPREFLGHYNLGQFYSSLGRYVDAEKSFHTCLNIIPDAPEALTALKNLKAGSETGDLEINSTNLTHYFKAIEAENWQDATRLLVQQQKHIDHLQFLAAACELPSLHQKQIGVHTVCDPSKQVYTMQLFADGEEILEDLAKQIIQQESLVWNRAGKPTREGLQTHEVLAGADTDSLLRLKKSLQQGLVQYLQNHDPWWHQNINSDNLTISGWGVVLKKGGFQKRHIHPDAKISGVLYIKVPESTASKKSEEGNLVFSTQHAYSVTPKTGMVVFFPSYLPHETIPHYSTTDRICVAFNFKPKKND
ncbi:MAG: hypothetical protein CL862_02960 [Cyanobium sp. NAT70]|nr:hypothetical protein [Cyanobium sp. NAT70]|tara:strand:- start:2457 stop:3878 length:1422 start_codon:yes stop_codon:yes gene_type:complete